MADTSSRMFDLLNLLQVHRYWHGPDLAERLGVSERTLRRDIDRLRGLGYHIESVRGADGGYQMASGTNLPPMVFTDEEAVALAIGLRDVAHGSDVATAEASLRALAKPSSILPAAVRRRVEQLHDVTEGPDALRGSSQPPAHLLGSVAQACHDGVRLRFTYRSVATSDTESAPERYVEPYRLVTRGRRWYLVAYDMDRDDWRTFRVDRMSEPVPARNAFSPRPLPADDLARYLDDRIRELRPRHVVEFEVHAPPEQVRATIGWRGEVTANVEGTCVVTMTVDDLDWALLTILDIDAPVHVKTQMMQDHLKHRQAHITRTLRRQQSSA